MLCGYLKQVCKSITVKELIEILQTCKNPNAIVQLQETTNFFVHFDQDGQFIDFSKSPQTNKYGEAGANNDCGSCHRYDKKEKQCKCDGNNCINAESIVDTEKLNELRSGVEEAPETREIQVSREEIQKLVEETEKKKPIYDANILSINGVPITGSVANHLYTGSVENHLYTDIAEEPVAKKESIPSSQIQESVDNAIIAALNKMINGIKGGN